MSIINFESTISYAVPRSLAAAPNYQFYLLCPIPFYEVFFYSVLITFKNSNSVPYSMFELVSNNVIQKFHFQLFFSVEQVSKTVIAEVRILSMNTQWSRKCTPFPHRILLEFDRKNY